MADSKFTLDRPFPKIHVGAGVGVWRGHEAVCLLVREISALSLKCSQIIRKWEPTEWDVFRTVGE